jgi:chaperone modulatory protein CbpM
MSQDPRIDVLDESHKLSTEELCERCQVEMAWIEEMVAQGVISPIEGSRQFTEVTVTIVRTARRLERDFELNPPGIALAMDLLAEINRLRGELLRRR